MYARVCIQSRCPRPLQRDPTTIFSTRPSLQAPLPPCSLLVVLCSPL